MGSQYFRFSRTGAARIVLAMPARPRDLAIPRTNMNQATELSARFREVVTSETEVRAVAGEVQQRALDKVVRVIDEHSRRFIAAAPFVFIASTNDDGTADVSPKGDPPGFVKVLDQRTLAIPDRLGNRRFDTYRNILRNPAVGLIFLIPGVTYTLRISGTAIIVRDADLRAELAVNGKLPDHVLVVEVRRVLSHCPKCMIRSGLWKPDAWPDTADVPSFAETLIAHARIGESVAQVEATLEAAYRDRLY
jgi:PPOX class probable FMN-dependent enzyme